MTAPTVTSHRIDDTRSAPSDSTHDDLVLETADPRRVRKLLGVVGAFLLVLVLLSAGDDSGSVALGVNPTEVRGTTIERPLPRTDTDASTTTTAPQPVVIQVPTLIPVDRPIPILVPMTPTTPGPRQAPQPRTANGPSAPEITRFYVETERPVAREATRFRFWAGDADGHVRYFRVDFGDGHEDRQLLPDRCVENPSDPVAERTPFSHTFEEPGTYTVTLTVASSGSCGNGPTQYVEAKVEVQVGIVDVGPDIEG